jgi:hypothetical protein
LTLVSVATVVQSVMAGANGKTAVTSSLCVSDV